MISTVRVGHSHPYHSSTYNSSESDQQLQGRRFTSTPTAVHFLPQRNLPQWAFKRGNFGLKYTTDTLVCLVFPVGRPRGSIIGSVPSPHSPALSRLSLGQAATLAQQLRRNQEVGLVYKSECMCVFVLSSWGHENGMQATAPPTPSRTGLDEGDAFQSFFIKGFLFSEPTPPPMPSSPGQRVYSPTPRGSPEESQLSSEMQKLEDGGPFKTKVGLLHPVYQLSSMGQKAQRM